MTPRLPPPASSPAPVVVAVDGSPGADAAAHAGARTARQRQAPLRLVRVLGLPSEDPVDERGSGVALRAAAAQLEDLRRELAGLLPEVEVTEVLQRGEAGPVLLAESRGAERLVLGAHTGSPGLGVVPGLLVRRAHSPVLLHRQSARPAGAVVVGLDGLPGTEELLVAAADEAAVRGAVLHVLHGRTPRSSADRSADGGGPATSRAQVLDAERGVLERLVERVLAERPRVRVRLEVRLQGAASELLDAAEVAQLLVLGRHGRQDRAPSTTTGDTVLLRSPCSVLLVPTGSRARTAPTARDLVGPGRQPVAH